MQKGWALLSFAASLSCPVSSLLHPGTSPQSISSSVLHPRVSSWNGPGTHSTVGPPALLLGQGGDSAFPQEGVFEGFGMFGWVVYL